MASSTEECERLREELSNLKSARDQLEEDRTNAKNRLDQLGSEMELAKAKIRDMERLKEFVEEQFKGVDTFFVCTKTHSPRNFMYAKHVCVIGLESFVM